MLKFKKAQDYLLQFMQTHKLNSESGRALVAVSGGVDSMVLLALLSGLRDSGRINELEAVHINHGTREDSIREQELVESFCNFHKIKCHSFKLSLSLDSSDFENIARKERYAIFRSLLSGGDKLYLGHHIDDSYEWSLLSQFRSGGISPSVGIPVLNGPYARPLMCFSKEQIYHLAKIKKVPFSEDASNQNTDFDRNYIRTVIVPRIAKRYPAYLKHYVYRSNKLCHKLGTHIRDIVQCREFTDSLGVVHLIQSHYKNDFTGNEERIHRIIQSLSADTRGVLGAQIKKLIVKAKEGKGGPILFSGDVTCYVYPGHLIFASSDGMLRIADLDSRLGEKLKKTTTSEIPGVDSSELEAIMCRTVAMESTPLLFSIDKDAGRVIKGQRSLDPLFPKLSQTALDLDLWFRPIVQYLNYYRKTKRVRGPIVRILRDKEG